jgi:hypothetical protein
MPLAKCSQDQYVSTLIKLRHKLRVIDLNESACFSNECETRFQIAKIKEAKVHAVQWTAIKMHVEVASELYQGLLQINT